MLEKRRHRRFGLELLEVSGKLSQADNVEIIDMSFGGVAVKVNRRLNIGKEYPLKLEDKRNSIDVKGIVARCRLSVIEEGVSIYTAGMKFEEGSVEKIAAFVRDSIFLS